MAPSLVPDITSIAGGAASQVTATVSSVISDAISAETSVLGHIFATNYTVGTKYAYAASSCDQIPSLEVVLCFGVFITSVSAIAFALAFFLPLMKIFTLRLSMLTMLFFIVFAVCVVLIAELASLVARSTFFHVEKGDVYTAIFRGARWRYCFDFQRCWDAVHIAAAGRVLVAATDTQSNESSRTVPHMGQFAHRSSMPTGNRR